MNMFPMTVTMPDGMIYRTCRMTYDGRDLRVWRWTGSRDPNRSAFELVLKHPVAPQGTGPAWYLKTETGTITLERQDGCGCGHPLKTYTPTEETDGGAQRVYTGPEVADHASA